MELPETIIPLTPAQRQHIKQLAEAATGGPSEARVVPTGLPIEKVLFGVVSLTAGFETMRCWKSEDACYYAAVDPNLALGTLAYVEVLEADNAMQAARLAELESQLQQAHTFTFDLTEQVGALQIDLAASTTQLQEARAEATKVKSQTTDLLAEFAAGIQPADIPGCLEAHSEPAFGEFLRGANSVHATNLRWVRWKVAEFGLTWPLSHAEFEFGYTPDTTPAAPALLPVVAEPAGLEDGPTYEQVRAAAYQAGFGEGFLSRDAWSSTSVAARKRLLAELVSGKFKERVLSALNFESPAENDAATDVQATGEEAERNG